MENGQKPTKSNKNISRLQNLKKVFWIKYFTELHDPQKIITRFIPDCIKINVEVTNKAVFKDTETLENRKSPGMDIRNEMNNMAMKN